MSFCTAASNDQTINTHHNKNKIHDDYETNLRNTLTKHLSITQPTNKTFVNNAHDVKNAKESTKQFRQSFPSHENMLLENNGLNEDNVAIKELKTKRQVGKESKNRNNGAFLEHVVDKRIEERKSEKLPRSSQFEAKTLSRNRYSFENELPVRDPGPYSPTLKQFPNDDKNETTSKDVPHSIEEQQLRSQVQKLLLRHQEDLKLVQESDLGISLPKPLTAIMSTLNKPQHSKNMNINSNPSSFEPSGRLQPDVVPVKEKEVPSSRNRPYNQKRGLISSSEMEEPPPRLHFAETPDDLTFQNTTGSNVDPFNFMSTVQRKFLAQQQHQPNDNEIPSNNNNKKPFGNEMVLSEGPLSSSFASSHQSEDNNKNNNVFDNAARESKRDNEYKKNNNKQDNLNAHSKNSRKYVDNSSNKRSNKTEFKNKVDTDEKQFISSDVKDTSEGRKIGQLGRSSEPSANQLLVGLKTH